MSRPRSEHLLPAAGAYGVVRLCMFDDRVMDRLWMTCRHLCIADNSNISSMLIIRCPPLYQCQLVVVGVQLQPCCSVLAGP